jgi:hypothetical protein
MIRSELSPLPDYFDRYINLCDDFTVEEAIQKSIDEIEHFPLDRWTAIGDKTYAEGKWTIKEILQHLIDTERIFGYRALAFARGESQKLPSFTEDEYNLASQANNRTLESLIEELKAVHYSFLLMYRSFTPQMLKNAGMGFNGPYTVHAIGYCMPGHQRWHMRIIEERYLSL